MLSIAQAYYDDIVTERSIEESCGYPLCAAHIKQQQSSYRPPAQYHISLAQKKVFDLTERRKFCSNFCFQASNYYRQQLETAPLWLREERTAVQVQLLCSTQRPIGQQLPGKGDIVILDTGTVEVKTTGEENCDKIVDEEHEEDEEKKDNSDEDGDKRQGEFDADADLPRISHILREKDAGTGVLSNSDVGKTTSGGGEVQKSEGRLPEGSTQHSEDLTPLKSEERTKARSEGRPREQRAEEPPVDVVQRCLGLWFTPASFTFLFRCQEEELEDETADSLRYRRAH